MHNILKLLKLLMPQNAHWTDFTKHDTKAQTLYIIMDLCHKYYKIYTK